MLNNNGFYQLTPKVELGKNALNAQIPNRYSKKNDKKITEKPKFKKGSWKYVLWKKIQKFKSSRYIEGFHFSKITNYLVYKNSKNEYRMEEFSTRIKKSKLAKLKDSSDAWIMINSHDMEFVKVSLKSYLKLMKIDKIAIEYELTGSYDDVDQCVIFETFRIIDNINDLFQFIKQHRAGIQGVYDMQSYCCEYTSFDFEFRMVVNFTDGTAKTYKSDMNDFMKDFKLYLF